MAERPQKSSELCCHGSEPGRCNFKSFFAIGLAKGTVSKQQKPLPGHLPKPHKLGKRI